jgi:predicted nuclease of predicted toxin-antitoxin system
VYKQDGLTPFNSSLAKVTSEHVKTLGLINTDDSLIWQYAKVNGFVIVSKDADFQQRSLVYGHPPKFLFAYWKQSNL